jgi:hypothetical protein
LIYFIFRDDTYVVSSIFTCLMIVGEFAARVRILLEKGPSRYHISEDQQFQKKYPVIHIMSEDESSQKEEARGAAGWAHHRGAQAQPRLRRPLVRPLWPTTGIAPSRISSSPKT